MVFTKDRHPHTWTIEEKKKLLELYKTERDWHERCKKMYESFPARRTKNFFSPTTCHTEFDKIIHSPLPVNISAPSSTAGYSIRSVVDIWIDHFQKTIWKEEEQKGELAMVDIRNCYALCERLLTGNPPMTDDQMLALLEEYRSEDAAKGDPSEDIIINALMRRLLASEEEKRQSGETLPISPCLFPPTKSNDVLPRGSETAFRSPSPSRSPIKTPIRRVAEAVREGISPVKTDSPQKSAPAMMSPSLSLEILSPESMRTPVKIRSPTVEIMDDEPMDPVEPSFEAKVDTGIVEPDKSVSIESVEQQNTETPIKPEKKPAKRGRAKPIDFTTVTIKEEKPDIFPQIPPLPKTGRSRRSDTNSASRTRKLKQEVVEPTVVESSTMPTIEDIKPSTPVVEKNVTIEVQTDISIISSFSKTAEKKERRPSTSKKSRGRTESTQENDINDCTSHITIDGNRRAIAVQCTRIEFDRDDKIVITWLDNERPHVPYVGLRAKDEDHEDADSNKVSSVEEEQEERRTKADLKKEIAVIYDVEDWAGKSLLLNPAYSLEDDSPAKRANLRKDDKQKEDSAQAKLILMNTLRAVQGHRHSTIFLHPVSEKEAPGYSNTIKQRMDLNTLKKEIEAGNVLTPEQMKHRLMKMFANAVMYNPTEHDINLYSKEMAKDTLAELSRLVSEGSKGPQNSTHPRRSRVAEESTYRPRRSNAPEPGKIKKLEERFGHLESKTRKVFRRKKTEQ